MYCCDYSKNERNKIIPFVIFSKIIKYQKKLTNEVQDLYIKNDKILLKKFIDNLSKKKDIPLYGLHDNIVTMTTISKLMYRLSDILIKALIFFIEIVKLILRFISQNNLEKKEQSFRIYPLNCQSLLQSHSKNSSVT